MGNGHISAAAALAMLLALPVPGAAAGPPGAPGPAMTMHGMEMDGPTAATSAATQAAPTQPGQGAFGALQEVVRILQADPGTDWSKVNLDALREHLIDMDRVTLDARAVVRPIPGGIRVAVVGSGRTLVAIQRLLPEEAMHLNGMQGWRMVVTRRADGVILTVTSTDARQVAVIRGLGFAGVLASGDFHSRHHLEIARGEAMH